MQLIRSFQHRIVTKDARGRDQVETETRFLVLIGKDKKDLSAEEYEAARKADAEKVEEKAPVAEAPKAEPKAKAKR